MQNSVSVSQFDLKILKKDSILTSNKGNSYVANLWRMTIYNLNVDLVYDNVYTKIDLNKSIHSKDIKKNISDVNQGPLLCCKFAKMTINY